MRGVPQAAWDALGPARAYPFLQHAFLDALEQTGCVGEETGWLPHHLSLWQGESLSAVAPAYIKTHSQGEFVFDQGWANAALRLGFDYYPKLVVAVPFTPATGPRILVASGFDHRVATRAIAAGLGQITEALDISSAHVLFSTDEEAELLSSAGLAHRHGVQFHWQNEGYETFEDFLRTLPGKKRTQIRRERRALAEQGLTIETLRGREITEEAVSAMVGFYESTVDKFYWGRRYLNRRFFESVCERLGGGVEIVVARDGQRRIIAGAFNLASEEALFGRYWGASIEHPFLHFNVCYYHSIEECIARRRRWFEPGAGGSHKVARGFFPTLTHSTHHVRNPTLDAAIRDFVAREREAIAEQIPLEWGAPLRHVPKRQVDQTTRERDS